MPGVYRLQHEIQGASGLPQDRYVNVFHVIHTTNVPTTLPQFGQWCDDLQAFYETKPPDVPFCVTHWMSGEVQNKNATIKIYRMADPSPGRPIRFQQTYQIHGSGVNGNTVPQEVAACLSYRAVPAAGESPTRYRGRIYIGPMGENSMGTQGRPYTGMQDTLINAGQKLRADWANSSASWIVYSPTRSGEGDQTDGQIVEFSYDNAHDTQRRRGFEPTQRTRFGVDSMTPI